MAKVNRVIFQCDDVGLVDDFKKYCKEKKMTMAGVLRKSMYEAVGEYRIARENKMFHSSLSHNR
jgi:hypothetical protein|tara:strand:+ start:4503 stop:4694 length:192 start_codon:yes stop_codon:yes gene_type:complete